MDHAGKNDPMGMLEDEFSRRGVRIVRERFRVPAFPAISPFAGEALGATGAFLLSMDRPGASFLCGVAGGLLLLLRACGFSPLDWLGPRRWRSALVFPGTPSGESRKALFVAVPACCRITGNEYFSREERIRRLAGAFGLVLCLALALLAAALVLRYISPLPAIGTMTGAVLSILAASEWARRKPASSTRNLAAEWAARSYPPEGEGARPFLFLFSGDEAEVKFFLAKYRRQLLRGGGIFVEFPEGAEGPPAVTRAEGPFLFPYRVDASLFSIVRATGFDAGVGAAAMPALRTVSGGLVAMSRGFRAVTLFRMEKAVGSIPPMTDWQAKAWLERILSVEKI